MPLVALAGAAAIADLIAACAGWSAARTVTKPLVALLLAAAVWRARAPRWFAAGLAFAACGDELLLRPETAAFEAGMAAFAAMHLSYIAGFARLGSGRGFVSRRPWLAVPYAAAYAGNTAMLWPHAGSLALPIAAYGAALTAMAVAALDAAGRVERANAAVLMAGGALAFMASDTLLAFAKFLPGFPVTGTPAEIAIVSTYFAAQLAIASGVIRSRTS